LKQLVTTTHRGHEAESRALNYLQKKGLHLIQRNYFCKLGEIDLIMQHKNSVVFVEVRMRKNNDYGSAIESVTRRKQIKIIKTASYYLQRHPKQARLACRFDVVSVSAAENINRFNPFAPKPFNWIQDAFQTTEWV